MTVIGHIFGGNSANAAAASPAIVVVTPTGLTTPDPVTLHASLRQMASGGCTACHVVYANDRWREIVGDQLAARTEPIKLIRGAKGAPGALELRVAGAGAALIQHQAPEIVERVNLFLGAGAINKLRIIQGPLQNLVPKGRPARRSNPPLDAALEAELVQGLAQVPDSPLKEALLKLGRGVMKDRRRH